MLEPCPQVRLEPVRVEHLLAFRPYQLGPGFWPYIKPDYKDLPRANASVGDEEISVYDTSTWSGCDRRGRGHRL
jgi:hypothetical protein